MGCTFLGNGAERSKWNSSCRSVEWWYCMECYGLVKSRVSSVVSTEMKPFFTKCGNCIKYFTRILKMSLFRLEQSLRVAGGWGSQVFWKITTWKCQGYQPYAPAAFNPRRLTRILSPHISCYIMTQFECFYPSNTETVYDPRLSTRCILTFQTVF
jgi:hypothetical protein